MPEWPPLRAAKNRKLVILIQIGSIIAPIQRLPQKEVGDFKRL